MHPSYTLPNTHAPFTHSTKHTHHMQQTNITLVPAKLPLDQNSFSTSRSVRARQATASTYHVAQANQWRTRTQFKKHQDQHLHHSKIVPTGILSFLLVGIQAYSKIHLSDRSSPNTREQAIFTHIFCFRHTFFILVFD